MKRHLLGFGLFVGVVGLNVSCRSTDASSGADLAARVSDAVPGEFKYDLDITKYKNMTYLSFMQDVVKPGLDDIAGKGYKVGNAAAMQATYDASGPKIKRSIDSTPGGGIEAVKKIATALKGQVVKMDDLPGKVAAIDRSVNRYAVATFIGLASGGGVKIKYAPNNYSFNIHYSATDKKSGRSFGYGPTGGFNDISDRDYLVALAKYTKDAPEDVDHFYGAIFKVLFNNDTSGYASVNPEGQTLLSNFLAVYTAEQDRNLMDRRVTPYWDAALLEVTLLGGFHAGQKDKFKLFYLDTKKNQTIFTDSTFQQTPCATATRAKKADMTDYWQFSRNITDPQNCKRSGINITNQQFRQLATAITSWMTAKHRNLLNDVRTSMGVTSSQPNIFFTLSNVLMSPNAAKKFTPAAVNAIASSWVKFLDTVQKEAPQISDWIGGGGGASAVMGDNSEANAYPAIDDIGSQGEDVENDETLSL